LVFAARVDGLVLLNPFAQGWRSAPVEELVGWDDAEQVEAYDCKWHDVYEHWGRGDSLRMEIPALATRRNLLLWGMLERAAASPGMIRAIHQAAGAADVRDVVHSVQARALVLRSAGHTIPAAAMRNVAELLPHASYQELPETPNFGKFNASWQRHGEQSMFGATRDVNPDRVLMTVLFTDMVGSTEQAALLGDARWREVLVAHERLLRREVEAGGGRVVKLIGGRLAEHVRRPSPSDPLCRADLRRRPRARGRDPRGASHRRMRGDRRGCGRHRSAHRRAKR
jgi:hypothetical protein